MKIPDADSAENDSTSSHQVVTPLSCALPRRRESGPKGSGDEQLTILPGTRLRSICGSVDAAEQYYCNYGVNEGYVKQFQAAGLRVSARGMRGETRAVELPDHRFFIANVTGAAIWAAGIPVLGYWLGSAIDIDKYIYPIVAVIIVLSLIPPFLEWRKHKKASQQQV